MPFGEALNYYYQLAFRTPGIMPESANLRKQILQTPNLRSTARGRPHSWQRLSIRELNFGFLFAFAILDLLATDSSHLNFEQNVNGDLLITSTASNSLYGRQTNWRFNLKTNITVDLTYALILRLIFVTLKRDTETI